MRAGWGGSSAVANLLAWMEGILGGSRMGMHAKPPAAPALPASQRSAPSAPLPAVCCACRLESRLLGNVRYFNDLIVTHSDQEYMARWAGGQAGDGQAGRHVRAGGQGVRGTCCRYSCLAET